jgi:hypothetical protein
MMPIEAAQSRGSGDIPAPATGPPEPGLSKRSLIPPHYTDSETTRLRVTVPEEGGVLDLELTSRP